MDTAPTRPRLGQPAPVIDLVDRDGNSWRSEDHLGQSIVVIFHRHIH
ncbi:MAG: peroxiredoxin [Candidatus Aldehydirespiratoraceae bacterium]|jgi:peroxiredoxin